MRLVQKVRQLSLGRSAFISMIFVSLLAGCSSGPALNDASTSNDPFEAHNRHTFALNRALDTYAIRPLAEGYDYAAPSAVRLIVKNELDYLSTPQNLINSLLQGNFSRVSHVLGRFTLNTTLGGLGLLDPATEFGLPAVKEDFGQTLAVYGVGEGFYWMAPLLGPSSPRDLSGRVVDTFMNPLGYLSGNTATVASISAKVTDIVDYRAQTLETFDALERGSTDFYASIRSAYRQKRNVEILNDSSGTSSFQDIE